MMKILFFGYKECPYSSDACNYLKQLDCEVTSIFSNSRSVDEEVSEISVYL